MIDRSSDVDSRPPIRITVWNEFVHESRGDAHVIVHYPDGIHRVIAAALRAQFGDDAVVRTATLQEPEHGLTEEVLAETDVLLWWGHIAHDEVADEVVERVHRHVLDGMGILVLHSAHYSKIFTRLTGSTATLAWRNDGEREVVWAVDPLHPIAEGVPNPIVVPKHEMYGEPFDIPTPDELIFVSNFEGGEVFRSGVTYRRGRGKVFYFSPGDQAFPVYHQPEIQRVLANGIRWARPDAARERLSADRRERGWFLS
jgi:trehalose utilization protein